MPSTSQVRQSKVSTSPSIHKPQNPVHSAGTDKKLREAKSSVFINEHLTNASGAIFAATRQLVKTKKLQQTWTLLKLYAYTGD